MPTDRQNTWRSETPLRPWVSSLSAPKVDGRAEQCRDRTFPPNGTHVGNQNLASLRCAIADGASYGYRCGRWAEILAREACATEPTNVSGLLSASLDAWEQDIDAYTTKRAANADPLKWYERRNLNTGAFSTLLVVDLLPYRQDIRYGRWLGRAVGDSCVFQVPAGEVDALVAHPLLDLNEFNTRPELVPTDRATIGNVAQSLAIPDVRWWRWYPGDRFYLCTDALAEWFIRDFLEDRTPWRELDDLLASENPDALARWLERSVEQRTIRNDDVSVMRVIPMS